MRRWLALRERRGLTYRELSERTGVSQGTLGYWAWKLRQEDREAAAEEQPGFVELVGIRPAKRLIGDGSRTVDR